MTSKITCPPSQKRLYVLVTDYSIPWRIPHWVNVYCGNSVSPVARLSAGIEDTDAQIEIDNFGELYLSDYEGVSSGTSTNALLIYDRYGKLIERIAKFGKGDMSFAINTKTGMADIFDYNSDTYRLLFATVGGLPPTVKWNTFPLDSDLPVYAPIYEAFDDAGTLFFQISYFGLVTLDAQTGEARRLMISDVQFIIGNDDRLYAREVLHSRPHDAKNVQRPVSDSDNIIRVYNSHSMRMLRSFRVSGEGYGPPEPMAASSNGTVALANHQRGDDSGDVEIYSPTGTREAVIRNIYAEELLFGRDDTLYVVLEGPSRFGPPGVYAFEARTGKMLRAYLVGKNQEPSEMALIPAGTLK